MKNLFDEKFLDLLICPKTGEDLIYNKKKKILSTKDGKNCYKIIAGVPRLIADE
jgi:uncharacterized protein YbaR (Trm112 family)